MRVIIVLFIFLIWSQEIQSKDVSHLPSVLRYELESVKHDRQQRSLADIWSSIKNTAKRAWESIKNIANNAKNKLADWIQKIKIQAHDLTKAFEKRLDKIENRLNEMIKEIMAVGESVKKCLQERKQAIDEIMKNILVDVTNCISNGLTYLKRLETIQYEPIPNETEFIKQAQDKLALCLKNNKMDEDVEECVHEVRKGIYEEMENAEESILQNHIEARSSSDDLLGTIIGCTTDGMIRASSVITNETIQIIKCVALGNQPEMYFKYRYFN